MSKVNIILDATMLNTFKSCPCKFNLRFNKNKTTPTLAKPLDKGITIHHGMEAYYKSLQAQEPWEIAVNKGLVSMRVALTAGDLSSEDGNRCLAVFEECCKRWRQEDLSWQIIAVEQAFSFVLYEDEKFRFIVIGKIDLVLSNNQYTNLPVDHKSYERDFPLSRLKDQFIIYALILESNYLLVNRIGFQTSIPPKKKHKRVPLSFDPIFFEQWKKDTIKWFFLYYDCCVDGYFPMNDTSCDKYNRACEYLGVCETSGEENKIYKLETNFRTAERWDVSKGLASKE